MGSNEDHAVQALEANQESLAAYPNVVGLGIVADTDDASSDAVAVAVYVAEKVAEHDLAPADVIPAALHVQDEGTTHTVPVKVIEQGLFEPEERIAD